MIKKIVCAFLAVSMLTVSVFAASGFEITAPKDFYSYQSGQNAENAAKILSMPAAELENYCSDNGIVFIAVNGDNPKQIRLSVTESAFSGSIGNLSNLSDDKIKAMIPDITGVSGGEVLDKDGQRFIKTAEALSDSGGEYSVINYVTVAAKKDYVLSFYTASGTSTDYAGEVFNSFSSEDFYKEADRKSNFGFVIIAVIVLLALGSAYIIFTLVRDIKNDRNEKST